MWVRRAGGWHAMPPHGWTPVEPICICLCAGIGELDAPITALLNYSLYSGQLQSRPPAISP